MSRRELSSEHIARALQAAWNDWCDDTGCSPDCFTLTGRKVSADFERGSFARSVAEWLARPDATGDEIKRRRIEQGWTQRKLAEAVGVGVPYISRIERGHERPSDRTASLIADLLGFA